MKSKPGVVMDDEVAMLRGVATTRRLYAMQVVNRYCVRAAVAPIVVIVKTKPHDLPIVRNSDQASAHNPCEPALFEIPGKLVDTMVWVLEALRKHDDDRAARITKTLLRDHRPPVIRNRKDARDHDPHRPALVEVPGSRVGRVFGFLQVLLHSPDDKLGKTVHQLLKISEQATFNGVVVTNVGPHSAAAKAGITRGDILVSYNGSHFDSPAALRRLTEATSPGSKVKIQGTRADASIQFEVAGGMLGLTAHGLGGARRWVH